MAGDGVCESCSFKLFKLVKKHVMNCRANMRTLAYFKSNILRTALVVYTSFHVLFAQKQSESASTYCAQYAVPLAGATSEPTLPTPTSGHDNSSTSSPPQIPFHHSSGSSAEGDTTRESTAVRDSDPFRTGELFPGRILITRFNPLQGRYFMTTGVSFNTR